ncbi:LuxR C-terminal-related transcriptional regulator [Pantoea sp. BAV 3049]|uniref:LuxR C-terminal-related transcriptional regulator n=1 Tax=Pantoea sp. BAV 3049 TaxID=2654188 RepID=UPI00131D9755|nr:LuxR C-terminal-related transcriptional regulator [Pantoea sp. BAV 3049]
MEDIKKPVHVVIYYNFNMFDNEICEYLKNKITTEVISIKTCSDHQELFSEVRKGNVDLIFTEYNYLYKNCDSGEQQKLKNLCAKNNVKTLIFMQNSNTLLIKKVIQQQYDALVSTHDSIDELQRAIGHLISDSEKQFISKVLTEAVNDKLKNQDQIALTSKEWEVVFLIAQGHSLSDIAAKKNRAISTVATQKQNAMKKLDIKSNAELLKYAYLNGML